MLAHLGSRIRGGRWCNGRVTLSDGDVAVLAEQAAESIGGWVNVRIEPDSGDDPYRWGERFWIVHFETAPGNGPSVTVRLAADDSEANAAARLGEAVKRLVPDVGSP
jgi:hypothetical protein